ncbi:MAG: acetoacetate--CoA ligase [Streptosporangiales bacterium]|nr:acetoacetate--CoA ligase [Streptosporangiales bacterium]
MPGGSEVGRVEEGVRLWEPGTEAAEHARVTRYTDWLARDGGPDFGSYDELWRWSVTDVDAFWDSLWRYFQVVGERGDGPVHEGAEMPGVHWFPGATLNYTANALRRAETEPERLAVIGRNEAGEETRLTLGELRDEVARVASGLRDLGVRPGDRVAAYVPNVPEALIAFLATASLGAIWSACSPDFGAASVIDRFTQIEPKVLVTVDGYRYNGKAYDRREMVADIRAALPSLAGTVAIDALGGAVPDSTAWPDLGTRGAALDPEPVPFEHPLWIVYSSGTTGLPKPIVHGHGGIVLEHLKVLTFHNDLGPDDTFCWFTTTGWMMWNYLIGGLLTGTTVVLYDGAATHPATDAMWRMCAETGVTYFGVGAPYLLACMKAELSPKDEHDLSALRGIGSTGSPLPPEGFAWVYEAVGRDLIVGSLSGGTDMATGFVGPSPLLPVRAGVIACRCLGAAVQAYDPEGKPLTGEVGELVITEPMPSMPVKFWNDPDGERYRESYFAMYPGIWRHGDWIKVLPDGGCVIYGRSDSTLNRGGVRMGTADFYRVVEKFPEVADSLVIDTGRLGAEGRLILYVVPAEGARLGPELIDRLRRTLRTELSPRHVPDEIHEVPGVPRTLSGKKLEVPVRRILQGVPVERAANPDAMANPEVLRHYTPSAEE